MTRVRTQTIVRKGGRLQPCRMASCALAKGNASASASFALANSNVETSELIKVSWIRRLFGSGLVGFGDAARSVGGWALVWRMQRVEECDERGDFWRRESGAVGGHVAATLNDLADDLIFGETRGDAIECGAALAAEPAECVAIVALLHLEDECALAFERRGGVNEAVGNFVGGPRVHVRTPRSIGAEMRERREADGDDDESENADGTAVPTFFSDAGDERKTRIKRRYRLRER